MHNLFPRPASFIKLLQFIDTSSQLDNSIIKVHIFLSTSRKSSQHRRAPSKHSQSPNPPNNRSRKKTNITMLRNHPSRLCQMWFLWVANRIDLNLVGIAINGHTAYISLGIGRESRKKRAERKKRRKKLSQKLKRTMMQFFITLITLNTHRRCECLAKMWWSRWRREMCDKSILCALACSSHAKKNRDAFVLLHVMH